jgi:2-dehydro-3-deoxyphosphogluconate aldolase/(4S)-4-hydroxy-2-oxoglutarate aldolase
MDREAAVHALKAARLVAIVRGDFAADTLMAMLDVLADNGISILEITLNTTGALDALRAARLRLGGRATIGAGTVRTPVQAADAAAAGAQFLVAPNFSPAVVREADRLGLLHIPGVATPTEAEMAHEAGCAVLKLFPADLLGGPAYLKAIRAPLDDLDFLTTGGIEVANIPAYLQAGAAAVGVGGSLVSRGVTLDVLAERARAFAAAAGGQA